MDVSENKWHTVNKGLPLEGVHSAHNYKFIRCFKKLKKSHYRPGQALDFMIVGT